MVNKAINRQLTEFLNALINQKKTKNSKNFPELFKSPNVTLRI